MSDSGSEDRCVFFLLYMMIILLSLEFVGVF